jgi:hypothetical protein
MLPGPPPPIAPFPLCTVCKNSEYVTAPSAKLARSSTKYEKNMGSMGLPSCNTTKGVCPSRRDLEKSERENSEREQRERK